MDIQLIQVPYDSGHEALRTGRGPGYFIQRGLDHILRQGGHPVEVDRIVSKSAWKADIETTFELDRLLAAQVRRAMADNRFPLVLAGSCHSCVGTLGGIGPEAAGVIWFDAHGDFNTPETTYSGMLDGMGLAMATGRCWRVLLKSVPGFSPVPEADVVHIGGRDFDPGEDMEAVQLRRSGIALIEAAPDLGSMRASLDTALTKLSKRVRRVYLHMDLDVLDTSEALANHAAAPGGLPLDFVLEATGRIKSGFQICVGAIASFDPEYDRGDKVLNAGFEIAKAMVA